MRDAIKSLLYVVLSVGSIGALWMFADHKASQNDPAPSLAPLSRVQFFETDDAIIEVSHPEYQTAKIVA